MQINFGVILNESMGDAVKITVIATGFQPESMRRFRSGAAVVTPVIRIAAAKPSPPRAASRSRSFIPEPVVEPEPEPEPQPAMIAEAGPDARPRRSGYAGVPAAGPAAELATLRQLFQLRRRDRRGQAKRLLDAGDRPGGVHERGGVAGHIVDHAAGLESIAAAGERPRSPVPAITSALSTSVTPGPTLRAIASRSSG